MGRSRRVDYDAIAHLYDSQPYRAKTADPELSAFLAARGSVEERRLLDIACGTGNQLIANRSLAPERCLFGCDGSLGMLRQAEAKAPEIAWAQSDAGALPFAAGSFDFVTCQWAFHHFRHKRAMLTETFRLLRPGGRFVMRNMCPERSPDWLYYDYFPAAKEIDRGDFWPAEDIVATMQETGFARVTLDVEELRFDQNLARWLAFVRRRDMNSQLLSISDGAYAAGIARLEREAADPNAPPSRPDHLCLVTIRGDKGAG